MTDRIDEIKRLLAEATPGPWRVALGAPECFDIVIHHTCESRLAEAWDKPNARLIAAAPELLGWAVAEIERLRDRITWPCSCGPYDDVHAPDCVRGEVPK